MKFILGFLFALVLFNFSPISVAYMAQYINTLHQLIQERVNENLENFPEPKKSTKLEIT